MLCLWFVLLCFALPFLFFLLLPSFSFFFFLLSLFSFPFLFSSVRRPRRAMTFLLFCFVALTRLSSPLLPPSALSMVPLPLYHVLLLLAMAATLCRADASISEEERTADDEIENTTPDFAVISILPNNFTLIDTNRATALLLIRVGLKSAVDETFKQVRN